jgi:hypothetical protein
VGQGSGSAGGAVDARGDLDNACGGGSSGEVDGFGDVRILEGHAIGLSGDKGGVVDGVASGGQRVAGAILSSGLSSADRWPGISGGAGNRDEAGVRCEYVVCGGCRADSGPFIGAGEEGQNDPQGGVIGRIDLADGRGIGAAGDDDRDVAAVAVRDHAGAGGLGGEGEGCAGEGHESVVIAGGASVANDGDGIDATQVVGVLIPGGKIPDEARAGLHLYKPRVEFGGEQAEVGSRDEHGFAHMRIERWVNGGAGVEFPGEVAA